MAERKVALLIHGAWMTALSWEHVKSRLELRGYHCVTPDGPFRNRSIEALRNSPDPHLATLGLEDVVEHFARHVRACEAPPLLVGHSLGGLVAQMLLDRDLGCGAVALGSAPPRGILPLHASILRATMPLLVRPEGWRRVARLSFEQWHRDFAGSLPSHDQRASFTRYVVPESGRIWYQLAMALLTGSAAVNFRNRDRRPLLLVAGEEDRVAPPAMVLANQRAYRADTALHLIEGRGHWMLAEHDADELSALIDAFAEPLWRAARSRPSRSPFASNGHHPVVVVGGGPAGLAIGAALKRRGVRYLILEREPEVGQSWRGHYNRLRLHTTRSLSGLPGLPIPRSWGTWVAAQDFATYLTRYMRHHELEVLPRTSVTRVAMEAPGKGWRVETSRGSWRADHVIVATGLNRKPRLPSWADGSPQGNVIHSSAYRGPEPYRNQHVLVVGAGNSGAEIALDLLAGGAASVRVAVRGGPNFLPRKMAGVPTQVFGLMLGALPLRLMDAVMRGMQRLIYGDMRRLGLPRPTRGLFTQMARDRAVPVIDVGFVAALATRKITIVAAVTAIVDNAVELADGARITPDAIIAATGYHADIGSLLDGGVRVEEAGIPALRASGEVIGAPGLYCAGFLISAGGVLRAIGRQAEQIAQSIATMYEGV